jgi:hypothetical protein
MRKANKRVLLGIGNHMYIHICMLESYACLNLDNRVSYRLVGIY